MAGLEGQTLGSYEILTKLGQGGMGAVYKARDIRLQRFIAIKVLPAQLAADEEFVQRFQREAIAAAQFCHSNLVQVFDIGESGDTHFIIMELVEGESLGHRLQRKGRMAPGEAIAVTTYMAQALAYAWNKAKLIHRDIKPANIFLSKDGEVKLGDLGLAKSLQDATGGLTMSGVVMGTPHYMSPEQGRADKQIDCRSDIYSLGCVLYHMLAGQPPYQGDSTASLIYKHVHEPLPSLRTAAPDCPEELAGIVDWMMAKKPEDRPQTYEELLAELAAARHAPTSVPGKTVTNAAVTIAEKTVPIQKPKSSSFGWFVAGTVLFSTAALGLWFWAPWKSNAAEGVQSSSAAGDTVWKDSVNLLSLVDPQKDVVSGQWKQDGTSWISDASGSFKGGAALLQMPYQPPEEYDYRITFTRLAGDGSIMQIVSRAGKNFGWVLRAERTYMGFERAGNKRSWAENPSAVRVLNALPVGSRHTSIVQVRKNGLTAYLDGQLVVRWPTDYTDFMGAPNQLRDPTLLGIGSWQNPVIFHSAEVREITGKGMFTRGVPTMQSTSGGVDDAFIKEVAALWPVQQVKRVVAEVKRLNPGYDGQEEHKIENGVLVDLTLSTVAVDDISPVRALRGLKILHCDGGSSGGSSHGLLADLSPLHGLPLEVLTCNQNNKITDLAPLAGMPLQEFSCSTCSSITNLGPLAGAPLHRLFIIGTKVRDFSPLKGMPLEQLLCRGRWIKDITPLMGLPLKRLHLLDTSIKDLAPLRGLPLEELSLCDSSINDLSPLAGMQLKTLKVNAPVKDLTPLRGMPLVELTCGSVAQHDQELLRSIQTLKKINDKPAAEFWGHP